MGAEHVAAAFEAMAGADLTPAAKLLLVAYALHLGPDGTPTKSWRKLEKICGIKRPTTVAAAKTLKDAGLLDVVKKSNHPGSKIVPLDGSKNEPHWLKNLTTESQPLARVLINNQEINNSRSNAGARVREDFVTSGLTHPPRPEAPKATPEAKALNKLCEAWPKRTLASSPGVRAAWIDILAEGVSPDELMACLGMAKTSKQWMDEYPRYVPQLANWLQGRQFAADLGKIRAERNRLAAERQRKADEESLNALVYGIDDFEEGEADEFD
jgi:hypothetical protein